MIQTINPVETAAWECVYSNASGAIYQCDDERCWYIDFAGKVAKFDYRCLHKLRKAVYHIDIEDRLLNGAQSPDVEIIFICACDHFYVLSLLQIIALKDLISGAFVMFQLNHIIQDKLYRLA